MTNLTKNENLIPGVTPPAGRLGPRKHPLWTSQEAPGRPQGTLRGALVQSPRGRPGQMLNSSKTLRKTTHLAGTCRPEADRKLNRKLTASLMQS